MSSSSVGSLHDQVEIVRDGDDAPRSSKWPVLFDLFDLLSIHLTIFLILRLRLTRCPIYGFICCGLHNGTHELRRDVNEQDMDDRGAIQTDLGIALGQLFDGSGYHDGVSVAEEFGATLFDVSLQQSFHLLNS